MCADCAAELRDPADRRYRHAFVNCTNCGPRFTIIASLPYDRAATTMARFAMCADCAREYADPGDRRFHAQPVCCPNCGPALRFRDHDGGTADGEDGLRRARRLLRDGGVLAVKGIGGYHLACDAGNDAAVAELRRRKQRGDKPFAVMVPDLATARARRRGRRRIRQGARRTAAPHRAAARAGRVHRSPTSVAPHNPDLGVMLAYAPLHALLFGLPGDEPGPQILVMTSGNLGGEPICFTDDDALERLARPCRRMADARQGRSWCRATTPWSGWSTSAEPKLGPSSCPSGDPAATPRCPIALPVDVPPTLAVGADLKNTLAVAEGRYAWLSQHIGDMDDLATLSAFDAAQRHLRALTGVDPEIVVADSHPGYRSTAWASRNRGTEPVRHVQHHHAHIAAVMAEHGLDGSEQVLGFAFDGTGYGPDGAVWGGEVLLADYKEYRRLAHLKYVPLAGGDTSVAAALPDGAGAPVGGRDCHGTPTWHRCRPAPRTNCACCAHQLETGLGCAPTSSMGRLFDAVAALAGVRQVVAYEAQAAIELEGLQPRRRRRRHGTPSASTTESAATAIDPAPVLSAVIADVRAGVPDRGDRRAVPPRGRRSDRRPRRGRRRRCRAPSRCPAGCSRTPCCCGWPCPGCGPRDST